MQNCVQSRVQIRGTLCINILSNARIREHHSQRCGRTDELSRGSVYYYKNKLVRVIAVNLSYDNRYDYKVHYNVL